MADNAAGVETFSHFETAVVEVAAEKQQCEEGKASQSTKEFLKSDSMYSNKLYTPLRYPGGKAKFAPFIAEVMKRNDLCGGHYLEPYAGGAGVALELLFHKYASHVHINDADPAVYAF